MALPLTATLFYKSSFSGVVAHFSTLRNPSPVEVAFTARAYLALQPAQAAAAKSLASKHADALGENSVRAIGAYADVVELVANSTSGGVDADEDRDLGTQVGVLAEINDAIGEETGEFYDGEKEQVECLYATVQHLDDDPIGALETLSMGAASQRNLGSLALGVHLLLLNHRGDIAQKEYDAARTWAEDSLVIQLIEASLGLYKGGRAAQQAYYVFDEFASASTSSEEGKAGRLSAMKLGRGVGLMRRGEWSKAEESVREAGTLLQQQGGGQPSDESLRKDVSANQAVLAVHLNPASKLSNAGQEHLDGLDSPPPAHSLYASLTAMDKRFDDLVASRAVAASS